MKRAIQHIDNIYLCLYITITDFTEDKDKFLCHQRRVEQRRDMKRCQDQIFCNEHDMNPVSLI